MIFPFSVGRLLLTKAVGLMDDDTDRDAEDITWQYKNKEGSQEERLAVYNAVRGVDKAMTYYQVPSAEKEDVKMDLIELESIKYGEPYKARIALEVSFEERSMELDFNRSEHVFSELLKRGQNSEGPALIQLHLLHWHHRSSHQEGTRGICPGTGKE